MSILKRSGGLVGRERGKFVASPVGAGRAKGVDKSRDYPSVQLDHPL